MSLTTIILGHSQPLIDSIKNIGNYIEIPIEAPIDAKLNKTISEIETNWIFYVKSTEAIACSLELFEGLNEPHSYYVQIFQGNTISKELRLWHRDKKLKFKNPIHETLKDDTGALHPELVLYSKNRIPTDPKELESWKNSKPFSGEPYYYEAFYHLTQKNYNKFVDCINQFLALTRDHMANTMARYYLSSVQLYIFEDLDAATRNILSCISVMPTMAEFWCLLGDIYKKNMSLDKAIAFYENAMILGEQRLSNDLWPIDITKYKEYPESLIQECKLLIEKKTWY